MPPGHLKRSDSGLKQASSNTSDYLLLEFNAVQECHLLLGTVLKTNKD